MPVSAGEPPDTDLWPTDCYRSLDPFVALSAAAAVTERLILGESIPLVLPGAVRIRAGVALPGHRGLPATLDGASGSCRDLLTGELPCRQTWSRCRPVDEHRRLHHRPEATHDLDVRLVRGIGVPRVGAFPYRQCPERAIHRRRGQRHRDRARRTAEQPTQPERCRQKRRHVSEPAQLESRRHHDAGSTVAVALVSPPHPVHPRQP